MPWDPAQYARYADERSRPFFDLFHRVPALEARLVVDLGCGSGELTARLLDRFPNARVIGVDNSPEMLAKAAAHRIAGRLEFVEADLASFEPPAPPDLLFSNAAVHWVPEHDALLPRWAAMLAPAGALAVQMPGNHDAPSHRTIREVLSRAAWQERGLSPEPRHVQPLAFYGERLLALGLQVEAWETTYLHVLAGPHAVLEWVKGTALRPTLARLQPAEQSEFLAELGAALDAAYPSRDGRTLFPFRRLFFVAQRP